MHLRKINTLLLCGLLALPLSGRDNDRPAPGENPPEPVVVKELEGLRTPTTRHFQLDNGLVRAEISARPTHVLENGVWVELDPRFETSAGLWQSRASLVHLQETDSGWRLQPAQRDEALELSSLSFQGQTLQGEWQANGPAALQRRGSAGQQEILRLEHEALMRIWQLNHRPAPGDGRLSTIITLPEGFSLQMKDPADPMSEGPHQPVVLDAMGRVFAQILPPLAWQRGADLTDMDAALAQDTAHYGVTHLEDLGDNRYRLIAEFSNEWLQDPTRQFPLSLDPSVTLYGTYSGYIYNNTSTGWLNISGNPTANVRLSGNWNGSGPTAGYMQFDVTSIPPNSQVSDATLRPYVGSCTGTATVYAYDAGVQAPFSGATTAQLSSYYTDLRGGESYANWTVNNGFSGLLSSYGLSDLERDLQFRIPDGFFLVGFASGATGDATLRILDAGQSRLNVTYDPTPQVNLSITEINKGSPDWVEIYNYGQDVDMTNYVLRAQDANGVDVYTFPSGFTLPRHQFVRVIENGDPLNNTATEVYTGFNFNWGSGAPGEAGLYASSTLYSIDYVSWDDPSASTVSDYQKWVGGSVQGNSNIIRRVHDEDTDTAADWTVGGTATAGALNAGMLGNRRRNHLVINEVVTGATDRVEILNLAPVAQPLDNWWMQTVNNGTVDTAPGYTFPAGVMVPPGGILVVQENGSAANNTPDTVFSEYNFSWTAGSQGEVSLHKNSGIAVQGDYMAFNNPQTLGGYNSLLWHGTSILPEDQDSWSRLHHTDADMATDWQGLSANSMGYLNPHQTDASRSFSDEIGTSDSRPTWDNIAYGVRYTATKNTTIVHFMQEVILNGTQSPQVFIMEDDGGGWSQIFGRTFTNQPDGGYLLASGPINLTMTAGNRYWFGVYTAGNATFPREGSGIDYASFGSVDGNTWSFGALSTSPSEGGTTWVAHQWIETLDGVAADPLRITTTSLPNANDGDAWSIQLQAEGGGGNYTWQIIGGSLPTGLTMTNLGLISGTINDGGNFSVTVRVTDVFGTTATKTYSFYVGSIGDMFFLTRWLPNGLVGQVYPDPQINMLGGTPAYSFTKTTGTLPQGLTLSSGGVLSGTPTTEGDYTFTIQCMDLNGITQARSFDVSIFPAELPEVWTRRGLNGGELTDLAVSPNWGSDGTAWAISRQRTKLFATHDQALNWADVPINLFSEVPLVLELAVSPVYDHNAANGRRRTLFALVRDGITPKLARSTNGGTGWTLQTPGQAVELGDVAISPDYLSDGTVAVLDSGEIHVSTNTGVNWSTYAHPGFGRIEFSPDFANDGMLFGWRGDNYLWVSTDLGASWTVRGTLPNSYSDLLFSPGFATDQAIFSYNPDVYKSTDGGRSFHLLWTTPGERVLNMQVPADYDDSQPNPRTVFLTNNETVDYPLYRSENGGQEFTRVTSDHADDGGQMDWFFTAWEVVRRMSGPFLLSPDFSSDQTLLYASQGVWLSDNEGLSWQRKSTGLNALTFRALAFSPNFASDGTLFVAMEGGGLYKSSNQGKTLTQLYIPHGFDTSKRDLVIQDVALSNSYHGITGIPDDTSNWTLTVFAAGEGGLYRSTDGGFTWTVIENDYMYETVSLAPNFSVSGDLFAIREAYGAQIEGAMYRSRDGGATMESLSSPWPFDRLTDAQFSPNYASDKTVILSIGSGQGGEATWRTANFDTSVPTSVSWGELTDGGGSFSGDIQLSNGYWNGSGVAARRIFWVGDRKTTDNGATWSSVEAGTLSTNFFTDNTLLRLTGGTVTVRQSTDGGATDSLWSSDTDLNAYAVVDGPFIAPGYTAGSGVAAIAMDGALLYSGDGGQTYLSRAGDKSISTDVRGIWTDKNDSRVVYVATGDEGLFKSTDKGLTFHHLTQGLPTVNQEFNDISVRGGSQQNKILAAHAVDGVYRSLDKGLTWNHEADTTGNIVELAMGDGSTWAARADGRSYRSSTPGGGSWTLLDPAVTDMVDFSYRGDVPGTLLFQSVDPGLSNTLESGKALPSVDGTVIEPFGLTSPTWGVSKTSGPVASEDGGTTFISANGSGGPFPIPQTVDHLSVLALSADNLQVLGGTDGLGLWKTWDGGDTWHRITKGLESSSQVVAELYEASNGDILAGITGTTDGGVYLSGDNGEHWVVINEGFDPDELSVQDLVNDNGDEGELSYWAGKDADGVWTRTIEVLPNPGLSALSSYSGSTLGGQVVTVTGTDFQDGAVVEFGGIPGDTTWINATTLTVVVPPHFAGSAPVVVINPDARASSAAVNYTFNNPGSLIDLTVDFNGTDALLSWTDPYGKGNYNVFWSYDPTFTDWVEPAALEVSGTSWTHTDVDMVPYLIFYKVE